MSGIRSTYLLQRSDDESLSLVLCVRDGDPDGRRHFSGSVALGGSAALVQYSPTRRDDFVRCDSSGARPKNFQTLSGYEQGLFGMEGRGLYAGGNVGGVYAQVAQNGGWSYGFQESVYFGVGDDFGSTSADGKQKNVGFEMWIPSLGSFGRFSLGDTYDVSKQGLKNAQTEALLDLAEKTGNVALTNFVKENGVNLDKTQYDELKALIAVSAVMETRHPDYSSKYDKDVIIPNGYNGYPHIEFKYGENNFGHAFSSYNYGSNVGSHLAIDFLGYYISRTVYDVND